MTIDLDRLDPADRAAVESELAVLMRAEDGAFGSAALRDLLAQRATGKTVVNCDREAIHGVLITWPGYEQPQVLKISEPLWRALTLPVAEPPDGLV